MSKSNNTYRYLSLLILASMYTNGILAQNTAQEPPRLVVNITIDQFRSDYMETFCTLFKDGGFNKLLNGGRVYEEAVNDFVPADRASANATISTGSLPYYNGIVSSSWLDRKTTRPVFCTEDKSIKEAKERDAASASKLLTSTIGDELKIFTNGQSKVLSIAPWRDAAILSAGHSADCVLWIDDNSGAWTSTNYYPAVAQGWAAQVTAYNSLEKRLKTEKWTPYAKEAETMSFFMGGGMEKSFSHAFTGQTRFVDYKKSALVNIDMTEMALQTQTAYRLGADDVTDLLCVQYYAGKYSDASLKDSRMELQDTYMRLDYEVKRLVETLESRVGKGRVLFVVTSTGCEDQDNGGYAEYGIPSGTFYINRTANLLNMYLVSLYGKGQYVDAAYHNQIYLNRKLIEQQHLDMFEVLSNARSFLLMSDGIRDVHTVDGILSPSNEDIAKIRNTYNPHLSGDIVVEVAPGWQVLNENTGEKYNVSATPVIFPIIFYGTGVKPGRISTVVSTDRIAPTISKAIRIRAPNGCRSLPLF